MNGKIEVSELEPGLREVAFSGRVDAQSAEDLRAVLRGLGLSSGDRVLVDLSAVELLDSMGIGVLGGLIRRAGESQAQIVLCGAPGAVQRTLEIAQFHRVVDMLADRAAALMWLAAIEGSVS